MRKTITSSLVAAHLARTKSIAITASLELVESVSDSAARVVACFNRRPSTEEASAVLTKHFGGRLTPVVESFREMSADTQRVVVAGFMALPKPERPLEETAALKEIAKNVFMDEADRGIWKVSEGKLVKASTDDLTDIVATASIKPYNPRNVQEALASISDAMGPQNTQLVAFFHEETAAVQYGVRIDATRVFSAEVGVAEIAHNLIVEAVNLEGQDIESPAEVASLVNGGYDPQQAIDYYRKLFEHSPEYWVQVEDILKSRSLI